MILEKISAEMFEEIPEEGQLYLQGGNAIPGGRTLSYIHVTGSCNCIDASDID